MYLIEIVEMTRLSDSESARAKLVYIDNDDGREVNSSDIDWSPVAYAGYITEQHLALRRSLLTCRLFDHVRFSHSFYNHYSYTGIYSKINLKAVDLTRRLAKQTKSERCFRNQTHTLCFVNRTVKTYLLL